MTSLGEEEGLGSAVVLCCKRQPGLCYWYERWSLGLKPTFGVPLPHGTVCVPAKRRVRDSLQSENECVWVRRYPHSQLQVIAVSFSQEKKGLDIAFHKTNWSSVYWCSTRDVKKKKKGKTFFRCFCFNYLLGKTLTNVQSSHPDLFIKAPFLIIWFNCECRSGGRGEKKKTLELEDIEKIKIQLLQIKNTGFKNKRKPQPKSKFTCLELAAQKFSSDMYRGSLNTPRKLCQRV